MTLELEDEADPFDTILAEIAALKRDKKLRNAERVAYSRGSRPKKSTYKKAGKTQPLWRPFKGADGEGGKNPATGRHEYYCLRIDPLPVLFNEDNSRLRSEQCLDYILELPPDFLYVGYFFDYDATHILMDLPLDLQHALFAEPRPAGTRYVRWRRWCIDYFPRQFLRVARAHPATNKPIEGSSRCIWEVGGDYQSKFTEACKQWGIGTDAEREEMQRMKDRRGDFELIGQAERDYNAKETEWLAAMMEELRRRAHAAGIKPRTWNGAGKFAAAVLAQNKIMRRDQVKAILPRTDAYNDAAKYRQPHASMYEAAECAYYGGRAELFRVGWLDSGFYSDIHSAYPAEMLELPCLEHTTWERFDGDPPADCSLYVADATFKHPEGTIACGLPWRSTAGGLIWPRMGRGWYWSIELESARRLGATFKFHGGWCGRVTCKCKPFAFVETLYRERQFLDRAGKGRGLAIKLTINSLYGKLAQQIGGGGPYKNPVWAGLITARTRAKINHAIADQPDPTSIVKVLTDAIVTDRRPVGLVESDRIGDWEIKPLGKMFFGQTGVYWSADHEEIVKTRGSPRIDFAAKAAAGEPGLMTRLEADWAEFLSFMGSDYPQMVKERFPLQATSRKGFISLRFALHNGTPELRGQWLESPRKISLSWLMKRSPIIAHRIGDALLTLPKDGAPRRRSTDPPIRNYTSKPDEHELEQLWLEGSPDFEEPEVDYEF